MNQPTQEGEREAIQWLLQQKSFNVAVTLDFDFAYVHNITLESIRKTLRTWDAHVNRKLLGNKWREREAEHLSYYAFVEKIDSIPHLHLIAQVPPDDLTYFGQQARLAWQKLKSTDHGEKGVNVSLLLTDDDREEWGRYITKDIKPGSWIYSLEFKNSRDD